MVVSYIPSAANADLWTTIEASRPFFDRIKGPKNLVMLENCGHLAIEEPGLFLYFPRRAAMAPKLRAFIDTAQEIGRTSLRTPGRVA